MSISFNHYRRSIRLPHFDYASDGAYFVTICTTGRQSLFGEIANGQMVINDCGMIVSDTWKWLAQQYQYVHLHEWVVMPNHFHGIIMIDRTGGDCRGGSRTAPTDNQKIKPLGRLVGAFKTVSTKRINEFRQTPGMIVWQRNYYEHIIRDDDDLNRIREYIVNNPAKWAEDDNNPDNIQYDKRGYVQKK
ncbi:MAG: transposase [Deltaproteobacteria bacterium]|nr:transposase [Deltaproteobacteria bacterium]